jgi:hypothetical protein
MNANLVVKREPVGKLAVKPHQRTILLVTNGSPQIQPGINNSIKMAMASNSVLAIAYFSSEPHTPNQSHEIMAQIAQKAREAGLLEVKIFENDCADDEAIDELTKRLEADLVVLAL